MIAECKNAPQCAPAKHHYDDCVERVQKQESEGEVTEDCVEECTCYPPSPSESCFPSLSLVTISFDPCC